MARLSIQLSTFSIQNDVKQLFIEILQKSIDEGINLMGLVVLNRTVIDLTPESDVYFTVDHIADTYSKQ